MHLGLLPDKLALFCFEILLKKVRFRSTTRPRWVEYFPLIKYEQPYAMNCNLFLGQRIS